MKTDKHILVAFLANLGLAVIGIISGLITGSFAIVSNSLHSLGDGITVGISFFLERKSKNGPDKTHTFGYARYSLLGSLITNMFLLVGAVTIIIESLHGLHEAEEIELSGMLGLAIFGAVANFIAAFVTRHGHTHNERAVSLHSVQDVLSWLAIIVGAIVMQQTGFMQIDAILSICIAIYILVRVLREFLGSLYILLDKTPPEVDYDDLCDKLLGVDGVLGLHHVHLWSLDGANNCATLHCLIADNADACKVKVDLREVLASAGFNHSTIEIEHDGEHCKTSRCKLKQPRLRH